MRNPLERKTRKNEKPSKRNKKENKLKGQVKIKGAPTNEIENMWVNLRERKKKSLKWEKKMELPQIKMKKKSNVKNPTSIIPSLKTLKIALSNHRANPQKSLKWRSFKNKQCNKKTSKKFLKCALKFRRHPSSVPWEGGKKGLSKKVSKKFFKCALKEKGLPKTSSEEVLQVCPQEEKGCQKVSKKLFKCCQNKSRDNTFRELQQPPVWFTVMMFICLFRNLQQQPVWTSDVHVLFTYLQQ